MGFLSCAQGMILPQSYPEPAAGPSGNAHLRQNGDSPSGSQSWAKAKGEVSSGAVEGLNNKIRVVTRRSYGFRTYKAMETALYHNLGRLPEPESTHRFC